MNAVVTIRYIIPNVCDQEYLDASKMTFEAIVRDLISEEGISGIAEDEYEIVAITEGEETP